MFLSWTLQYNHLRTTMGQMCYRLICLAWQKLLVHAENRATNCYEGKKKNQRRI